MQEITIKSLIENVPKIWRELIGDDEFNKTYWSFIVDNLESNSFYPSFNDIFKALSLIEPQNVKCIIIGQDPYIKQGQANGLAFSVNDGVNIPPSLRNIYHEILFEYLKADNKNNISWYIKRFKQHGDLSVLSSHGVLLLNTILTVQPNKSNSHKNIGWEYFTGKLLQCLDNKYKFVVMAWGNQAKTFINSNIKHNIVLSYGHPSPLNTYNPFIGCGCFKKTNEILKQIGLSPIKWFDIFLYEYNK